MLRQALGKTVLKLSLILALLVATQPRFDGLYPQWNNFRLSHHPSRHTPPTILVVQAQAVAEAVAEAVANCLTQIPNIG